MKTKFQQLLNRVGACGDARDWVANQSLVEAWRTCENFSWLVWFAHASGGVSEREWRLLTCAIARTALPYVSPGESRPRTAIDTAERFARGEASREELSAARSAAWSAARSAAVKSVRENLDLKAIYAGYKIQHPDLFP